MARFTVYAVIILGCIAVTFKQFPRWRVAFFFWSGIVGDDSTTMPEAERPQIDRAKANSAAAAIVRPGSLCAYSLPVPAVFVSKKVFFHIFPFLVIFCSFHYISP